MTSKKKSNPLLIDLIFETLELYKPTAEDFKTNKDTAKLMLKQYVELKAKLLATYKRVGEHQQYTIFG